MKAVASVNIDKWQHAVAVIQQRVKKSMSAVLNRSAASIAIKCYKRTKFVRDDFLRSIYQVHTGNAISYRKKDSKDGKHKAGEIKRGKAIYGLTPQAYGTMVERFRLKERGEALRERVEKLVRLAIISTEFIRSGWVQVMQGLAKYTKTGVVTGRNKKRQKKHPLGRWKEAKESWLFKSRAEIWNLTGNEGTTKMIQGVLDSAVSAEARELQNQARRMIKEDIAKANA